MIDLRSDTQTKPSQAMREAMARAEVGDEQEREDPTVLELERRGAELLGQEEAVYLPTATMGNRGGAGGSGVTTATDGAAFAGGEAGSALFPFRVPPCFFISSGPHPQATILLCVCMFNGETDVNRA